MNSWEKVVFLSISWAIFALTAADANSCQIEVNSR